MFLNKMETEAIPERVFALCKLLENKPMTNSDAKEKIEPAYLNNATDYYGYYRTAAEELQLISNIDNTIALLVEPHNISNMDTMRYYINGQLDRFRDGQFYKVTSAYFSLGDRILHGEQNVANMDILMSELTGIKVDSDAMRAWRFWSTYLGFGYLQKMFVIPNADVFLLDIIKRAKFKKNNRYAISEFLNALKPYSDIIIDTNGEKRFSYGVSNGFRTLQDAGYINMEYIMDQGDSWNLYHIDALSKNEKVSNITVLK